MEAVAELDRLRGNQAPDLQRDRPDEMEPLEMDAGRTEAVSARVESGCAAGVESLPLRDPTGHGVWQPMKDPKTSRVYWTNHALQKTAWKPPQGCTAEKELSGSPDAPTGWGQYAGLGTSSSTQSPRSRRVARVASGSLRHTVHRHGGHALHAEHAAQVPRDGHALHAEHAEHAEQVPRGGRERGGKGKGPDSGEQDGEGR